MEDRNIIGTCGVSGEPIYEGDAYITDNSVMYKPENYDKRIVESKSLLQRIFNRS